MDLRSIFMTNDYSLLDTILFYRPDLSRFVGYFHSATIPLNPPNEFFACMV